METEEEITQPKNHADLLALHSKKMGTHYKVKEGFATDTKDVDMQKRVVKVVPNTFNFFDSDQDVLIPGSTLKSITERGPGSTASAKIKNVYAHNLSQTVGVPQYMDEREENGYKCQYAESKIITTTKGNDTLIEYQEKAIDNHSIGFQYVDLEFISADDKDWTKWVNILINGKDAEAAGYMFLVKEIKQFEFSPVAFGANALTPYLGVKSGNKEGLIMKTFERIDFLERQYKTGRQTDETLMDYQLQSLQLKQIIGELFESGPSIKDTLVKGRHNQGTHQKDTALGICQGCHKDFNYTTAEKDEDGYVKCTGCGQFVDQKGSIIVSGFDWGKAIKETTFIKSLI